MARENFYILAVNETEHWDSEMLASKGLRAAFGLYLFRSGEATHCCSLTPSTWCEFISNGFVYDNDDDKAHEAAGDLMFEGAGESDHYRGFLNVAKMDKRFVAGPIQVDLDGRTYAGGVHGDDYQRAIWDEAREMANANSQDPRILWTETFEAWEIEARDARRREMRPVAGLPLFRGF